MNVKSIQCKSCAAPLSLYGNGHRIRTLSCEYCGAVMDARKDYALLAKFTDQYKPHCPLSIGMQGTIKDVPFIIIAMVGYRSNFGDQWIDLQLYSETHGYAWLSYTQGHLTFTRRVRDLPNKNMSQLTPRSGFKAKGQSFLFFEAYQAEITYVAGELTWLAKVGDTSALRDGISPPFMFSQEVTDSEQEYYLTEYMDAETLIESFNPNVENDKSEVMRSHFIHPAQPLKAPIREALSKASRIPLVLSLVFLLGLSLFADGKTIFSENISAGAFSSEMVVRDFTINNAKHLINVDFRNLAAAKWRIKDITLFDEQNEVFAFDKKLFSKTTSTTSEQRGSALFTVPKKGKYTLRFRVEDTLQTDTTKSVNPIKITIKEGVMSNRYFKYLFYLSLVGFLLWHITRFWFEHRRWAMNH